MASGFAAAAERRVLTDLAPCTNAAVGGVLICLAAIALALQLTTFPNHDVAWILWGTREMLDGAEFGRDIIEPNPPLAWYLAVPSTWLAGQFGIPVAAAFRTAVTVAALASLTAFQRLLPPMSNGVWHYLPLGVASLFLLILPGREFGQREHLMIIAGFVSANMSNTAQARRLRPVRPGDAISSASIIAAAASAGYR